MKAYDPVKNLNDKAVLKLKNLKWDLAAKCQLVLQMLKFSIDKILLLNKRRPRDIEGFLFQKKRKKDFALKKKNCLLILLMRKALWLEL